MLGLVRECPHCGLAAVGATTLSDISSQVLIWPLMGLDELGASLYREREKSTGLEELKGPVFFL